MALLTIKANTSEIDAFQRGKDDWFGLAKNPYTDPILRLMWDRGHTEACEEEERYLDSLANRKRA